MKINTSILNSAFSKYYHYLFKLEVIQDTRGDLGHIEKIAEECVPLLYIAPHPRPTVLVVRNFVEKVKWNLIDALR